MSDHNKKKKKKRGKNKKKGNENLPKGAASVENLEFKVDISSPEVVLENQESNSTEDSVANNPQIESKTTDNEEENYHNTEQKLHEELINDKEEENEQVNPVNLDISDDHQNVNECRLESDAAQEKESEVEQTNIETNESTSYDDKDDNAEGSLASSKVDTAVAHTVKDFFGKSLESDNFKQEPCAGQMKPLKENEVVLDVQKSPWKIDPDVREIVEHNKRVRMTKITKTRKVIVTKTDDGEEIETVVEEEDDDDPEVIGEIGAFDEDGNETVEIQRITKKRRVIVTKSAVKDGTPSIDEDDVKGEDTPYEETTTVTRRVVITKNEFDEDVETIFEEENLHKYEEIGANIAIVPENDDKFATEVDSKGLQEEGAKKSDTDDDDDAVKPTEIFTVEREVNLEDILGPADAEHEAKLKQQGEKIETAVSDQTDDDTSNHVDDITMTVQVRDVINEECNEVKIDSEAKRKEEHVDLSMLDNEETKVVIAKAPRGAKMQVSSQLTEEQRQMLEEVKIPEGKNVLDDWVLVNFTANEVMKFAELMRLKPGWADDSMEIHQCCKMM